MTKKGKKRGPKTLLERLGPRKWDEIVQLKAQGVPYAVIAKQYGIGRSSVYSIKPQEGR